MDDKHLTGLVIILVVMCAGLAALAGYAGQRVADAKAESFRVGYAAGMSQGHSNGVNEVYSSISALGVCKLAELGCPKKDHSR